ncbi:BapA/Bap/LapF family prefix-like domain-containing protein [Acinetobacter sp. ANC 3832]|uniref:BapA/Bap/LapF family prefix-like domain-containing protein n=1 Tax=Acinetobacter sp. ANC 3832 TaxID=1977874 RepID=UPI000A3463EA|nr:Ig-like domain-containing protein [Acinetobacter sp. ANC 3832]OTG94706.1 hypothetical protein B9T35_04830 [Acinetobacter sp. ANC 3832]
MQNFTVIDKVSLSRFSTNSSEILLEKASIIQTKLHKEDIAEIIQNGNDLIIKLKNGETITLENYFVKDANGQTSDLVFEGTVCAFEKMVWEDGAAAFKEVTGLEELLPIVTGSSGGIGGLPWIIGGVVAGGIGAATGSSSNDNAGNSEVLSKVLEAPTIFISNDKNNDSFLNKEELGSLNTVNVSIGLPNGARAGDKVTVIDQTGKEYTHTVTSENINAGVVTIEVDRPIEGCELKVTATVTNDAGESAESIPDSAVVDTVPARLTIEVPATGNDNTPTITGKTDEPAGSTIEISITDQDGASQTVSTTVKEDGSYTVDVPNGLPDGEFTVVGKVTDPAGNSTTATDQGKIDSVPPRLTIEVPATGNDNTPTITGKTDEPAGSTIEISITDQDGASQTVSTTVKEDGSYTVDVPNGLPDGEFTVVGKVTDPAGNSTTATDQGKIDSVPPRLTIELEENNLIDPVIMIKFSEVPYDANGIPLTAAQIKSLLTTQGFDFNNPANSGGLISNDDGLTWTAPITYTIGDAKASIADSSYFDAVKNSGSGATDSLIAPEVISVEPTKSLEVTGGNMGGGQFESGIISGGVNASKFNKHDLNVDLGSDSDNARIIINLNEVDNAFTLMVNGVDLIKSNNSNKAVFQMENSDKTHGTNQILLKYYDSKGDLQEFGTAKPWEGNIYGLPRIQVVITEDGVRLFGTLSTTSTELVELYISDVDMSRLNHLNLKDGVNTISVINPDSTGADEIKGNVSALSGAGFTISDDDSGEVSKAVIKVTGDLNGTIITPVLPEGMKAVWKADHSELTLIATNGALDQQDFTDAINLLMFGVKSGQSISAGERKVEITVYDEDGLKSDTVTGVFDYQSGLGNIYINQFDFSKSTLILTLNSDELVTNDIVFNILNDDNLGGHFTTTENNFIVGSAQKIDLSHLLDSTATALNIHDYLGIKYDEHTQTATLTVDRDGQGTHYYTENLLLFTQKTTKFDLDELLKNNQIIF